MKLDRKLGIAILGLLLIGIGYVSLSGGKSSDSGHDMGSMSHGSSSDQMSSSDAMFLQMMIPHHQQAVVMSDLAVKNSSNPEIIALAEKIRDAQGPEIAAMKGWLKAAGLGEDPGHSMGSMKGMLTEDDLASLKKATGKEFDRLFLSGMIAHHDGAVEMLSMIEKTTNPDIKRLGNEILTSQSAEIEMMSQMLKAIGWLVLGGINNALFLQAFSGFFALSILFLLLRWTFPPKKDPVAKARRKELKSSLRALRRK